MNDLPYWVATSAIPGVGTVTFDYLQKHFKILKKFWEANDSKIEALKVDARTKQSILDFRQKIDPSVYLSTVYERGIKVLSLLDRDYPANLRQVSNCPKVLYYKGNLQISDDLAMGVVGARYATGYGRQVTEKLVFDLVSAGLTIVSGMAKGIDSVAHQTALDAGGRTIAVLGCGVDVVYPPENKGLYGLIIKNGAVVSEFPLGFPAVPSNFPARNRIVSGLSLGVLVTEAAVDSGSLITAGQAAEQGREVFAVPGPINSKMSEGANNLIKEGVHPTTSAEDILQVLDIERKKSQIENSSQRPVENLTKDEKQILDLLDGQTKHIDVIARESKIAVEKVSATLSILEMKGIVKTYSPGVWGK